MSLWLLFSLHLLGLPALMPQGRIFLCVDLLGGEIHIDSEVGKGTHVEVRIPVGEVDSQPEAKNEVTDDKTKSLNILVFDDDNTLLSVIDTMLHRLGHQAIPCRSMSDMDNALQQIQDYDYILTDREMGAVTGNDILHLVKEADPTKPVILMTARMEYTNEMAKKEGFDGFLQKPFNLKQLENLFGSVASSEHPQDPLDQVARIHFHHNIHLILCS